MPQALSPQALQQLREGHAPFALIDVRETGEHKSAHMPDSSLIPRRQLAWLMATTVPVTHPPVVVYDDNGQRATRALGSAHVSALAGGMVAWQAAGLPLETGLTGVMHLPTDDVLSGPDRHMADAIDYLRWETALGDTYHTASSPGGLG
jgi:rhodanese-related sulfurtransferase